MALTLIIAILSIVVLMVIHEFGHFIIAKKFGVKVEEFGIGYPPRIFGKKFGETLYSLNLVPLGAFVKIYGEEGLDARASRKAGAPVLGVDDYRSFSNLKIYKRVLICLGGVIAFWITAIIIFSFVFGIGASVPIGDQDIKGISDTSIKILEIQKESPAELAGLKVGDQILDMDKVSDFQKFVSYNKGKQITLLINRNGKNIKINITPRLSHPEGQGPLGIVLERFADLIKKYSWYQAPIQGTIYTGKITLESLKGIYGFFASLFTGRGIPIEAQLAGPVGITIFLAKAVDLGAGFFLYFIGSLTVLLAIFNLLPIPALDGGKLLFLTIEKIMKKPVPVKWEQGITILFFVLLITMSLFVTVKFDIPRVVDLWKASL